MTILEYLTVHRGFSAYGVTTSGSSIIYRLINRKRMELFVESMPDGVLKVSYENETRIIPSPDVIKAALHQPDMSDSEATIRMLSQVIDKLIRKHRGDIEGEVEDKMSRHSRQKL